MNQDIFVAIEHLRGKVSEISYIMLAAAHALAKETGGQVSCDCFRPKCSSNLQVILMLIR